MGIVAGNNTQNERQCPPSRYQQNGRKINFLFSFVVGQHGHLSSGLHPAHAHMHGGWYPSGMGALGASSGLQGGFSSGSLSGGVVPHSQSYHLGISTMVSKCFAIKDRNRNGDRDREMTFFYYCCC